MLDPPGILHALRDITPDNINKLAYDAADLIARQAAEIERMHEAFSPLAQIKIKDNLPDETLVVLMDFDGYVAALPGARAFTVGDFRRLQAVFAELGVSRG
jgi:hypothetical protein